jgi:hypothetical protein
MAKKKAAKKAKKRPAAPLTKSVKGPPSPLPPKFAAQRYAAHRERSAERQAEASESGRDIGELPPVADPARRAAAAASFKTFAESYFPATFSLPWSDDHIRVIAAIEASVVEGGLFAFAMPRGSGKTSLVEAAALWALLYGYREFVAIVGSDERHAGTMLTSIKVECETNELLLDDFPEAVFPIVALERIHQRAKGQLYKGKPTHIQWTANEVQFPTIPGSKASSGIIRVAGITGRIRGMSAKRAADGRKVRPSLVLIDDPQTDESARSPSQVQAREAVLKGAILGLAGPGCKIAGLCTVTVVCPEDLADRLLDRRRHPAWQGQRTKLVYEWPQATSLWDQYADLRKAGQRSGDGLKESNDFYAANQAAMDAGSRVAWPARKQSDELTAIQHAMNLRIDRGEAAFAAEFQNEPLADDTRSEAIQAADVAERGISVPRWIVPRGLDTLVGFIDVQEKLLYWSVVAWGHQLRGHLVAYGTYPDQNRNYFTLRDAKKTLAKAAGGASLEAAIYAGLENVATEILDREFTRESDDALLRVSQLFVDANWAQTAGSVRDFCRRSKWGPRVLPTHGRFVGASGSTISDKKPDRGERVGSNWRTSTIQRQRHVLYDTNAWKTFMAARLKLPPADLQAFTMHAGTHDLLSEHLASEYPTRVEARGRVVDEWRLTPGRDNHWLDCLVGSAVAASYTGVSSVGVEARAGGAIHRKQISREEMQRKREELLSRMGR